MKSDILGPGLSPFWTFLARFTIVVCLAGFGGPVAAQVTVTRNSAALASDNLGKVTEGTTATTFTVEPYSDTVSSNAGQTGHTRFEPSAPDLPSIVVNCGSSACVGATKQVQIRLIKTTSPSRINLTQWSIGQVTWGGGGGYPVNNPSGTTDVVAMVQFNSFPASVSFTIGQTMTIAATGASGNLDVGWRVTAGVGTAGSSGGVSGTLRTIMYRAISIAKNTDLVFGQVKRPPSGTGHVIIDPNLATNPRSVDGGVVLINDPSATRAKFTTTGEGAAMITVVFPASVTLYGSRGGQMTLVPTGSGTGGTTLSGSAGSAGTKTSYIGGSLAIDSNDPTGNYSGTLTITSTYN